MKNIITIALVLLCTVNVLCAKTTLNSANLSTANESTISTKANAYIYRLSDDFSDIDSFVTLTNSGEPKKNARRVVNLDNCKIKCLRKPTTVKLLGFANNKKQLHFDAYLIEYKDNLYCISEEGVQDNSFIDNANKELDVTWKYYLEKVDSLSALFQEKENYIRSEYDKIYNEKIHSFYQLKEDLRSSLKFRLDSVSNNAKKDFALIKQTEFNDWCNKQSESVKRTSQIIIIRDAELGSPNSAGGCDFSLRYTNTSKKVIKYLSWSGWVYNAVGDRVQCSIRGSSYKSGRGTGPIDPDQEEWNNWECIIYNWSAETLRLSSIDIQYMDGSRISIKENDLKDLIKSSYNLYSTAPTFRYDGSAEFTYVRDVKKAYESKCEKKLIQIDKEIKIWRDKLSKLKHQPLSFFLNDTHDELTEKTKELISLQKEVSTTTSIFEDFKAKNLMK